MLTLLVGEQVESRYKYVVLDLDSMTVQASTAASLEQDQFRKRKR